MLSLVAILPMLLPSGMCMCQFVSACGPSHSSHPSNSYPPASETPVVTQQTGTACKNCCRNKLVAGPKTEKEASPESKKPNREDSDPQGGKNDCPVVTGLSPRLAVMPFSVSLLCILADTRLVVFNTILIKPSVSAITTSDSCRSSSPLFISQCSLLI